MSGPLLKTLLILSLLLPGKLPAQNFEAGAFGGVSSYIGDLYSDRLFHQVYPAAGAVARINHNQRLSTRFNATYSMLLGDDRDTVQLYSNILEHVDHPSVYYAFETRVVEVSVQGEFHLLPYRHGDGLAIWTPYLFAGAGGLYFSPDPMQRSDGSRLRDATGGAHWHIDDDPGYFNLALVGFAGLGAKYSLSEKLSATLEAGLRITGTDYLDEVSHKGDPGQNDWYTFTGLTLTYSIVRKRSGIRDGHIRHTRPAGSSGPRCPR